MLLLLAASLRFMVPSVTVLCKPSKWPKGHMSHMLDLPACTCGQGPDKQQKGCRGVDQTSLQDVCNGGRPALAQAAVASRGTAGVAGLASGAELRGQGCSSTLYTLQPPRYWGSALTGWPTFPSLRLVGMTRPAEKLHLKLQPCSATGGYSHVVPCQLLQCLVKAWVQPCPAGPPHPSAVVCVAKQIPASSTGGGRCHPNLH